MPPQMMQLSHMPVSGVRPASGLRLSCMQLTDPLEVFVVRAAQVGPGGGAEAQLLALEVAHATESTGSAGSDPASGLSWPSFLGSRSTCSADPPGWTTSQTGLTLPSVCATSWAQIRSAWDVKAGFGCSVSQYTTHTSVPTDSTSMTPKITAACQMLLSILPNMNSVATGIRKMPMHSRRLVQALGFSKGWARVGAEEAAAVGAKLLDGDDGGHWAAGDGLCLVLPVGVYVHRPGDRGGAVGGHRHAARHQGQGHDEVERHEEVDEPRHMSR